MQNSPVLVSQSQVETACRSVCLGTGDIIIVHASLSRLGYVIGGAEAVVRGLLSCIGGTGTLMAPSQTWLNLDPERQVHGLPEDAWPRLRNELPGFDPAVAPSVGMGAVAEMIRTWPGAYRSHHPSRSWAAVGAKAADLTATHDLDDVHGERSPLGAATRARAKVALIGVGYNKCTALHLSETRAAFADSPKLRERSWVLTPEGRREISYTTLDFHDHDFIEIGEAFEAEGFAHIVSLGASKLRVFEVGALVDFATHWMREHR